MIGVWPDLRVGGVPSLRLCERAELMRVPDQLLECVCFVHAHFDGAPPGEQDRVGSAFFVAKRLGLPEPNEQIFAYVVTARHCLQDPEYGVADAATLRVNRKGGGTLPIEAPVARWMLHPTADVAVAGVDAGLMLQALSFRAWDIDSAAGRDFRDERQIGPGDDAFITGLLVHHPGKSKIMPIVRVGNIAALPDDPVQLATGLDTVGLLEVRSIGGLSGSPVFLHLPFHRDVPDGHILIGKGDVTAGSGGESRLLGVMHGFYPVGRNDPEKVSGGREDLNTGIAVVTFVDRVMDLINREDQVKMRDSAKKNAETTPIPTTSQTEQEQVGNEFERFQDLARRLVQTPKPDED
jgi:hypothetical protein